MTSRASTVHVKIARRLLPLAIATILGVTVAACGSSGGGSSGGQNSTTTTSSGHSGGGSGGSGGVGF